MSAPGFWSGPSDAPSASDFWTERSNSLHGVLQVPADAPAEANPVDAMRGRRRPARSGVVLVIVSALVAAAFVGFAVLGGGAGRPAPLTASGGKWLPADSMMKLAPTLAGAEALLGRGVDAGARAAAIAGHRAAERIRAREHARQPISAHAAATPVFQSAPSAISSSQSALPATSNPGVLAGPSSGTSSAAAPTSAFVPPATSSAPPTAAAAAGSGRTGAGSSGPTGQGAVVGPADCSC